MSASLYREFSLQSPSVWQALTNFVRANYDGVKQQGKTLRVIVTIDEAKRNAEQNKRYFGYVLKHISEQAWVDGRLFEKDAWHEYYARKFGVCEDIELPGGEVIVRRKSTSQMGVGEFATYMCQIEAYATQELGVEFP